MNKHHIELMVNGQHVEADVEPRMLLVHFLREALALTGTHIGCDTTSCGACTVHLNGKAVKSCTVLAVQANGGSVLTVEGLAQNGQIHPIQEAFHEMHGLQCGFCTPGMMLESIALLEENPAPTEEEIRMGISGNLCRCTGYVNIVKSIRYAADKMRAASGVEAAGSAPVEDAKSNRDETKIGGVTKTGGATQRGEAAEISEVGG